MILFTTINLTPDMQQIAAWLVTEGLAWLQSAAPAQLAIGVLAASWGLAGALLVWGRGLK